MSVTSRRDAQESRGLGDVYKRQPEGRVEGVAGCGLAVDTTTSLATLGHDIQSEAFVQALLSIIRSTLGE